MRLLRALAIFSVLTVQLFADVPTFQIDPIHLTELGRSSQFIRSIYSLDLDASEGDTALFLRKPTGLAITNVDSVNQHELAISFRIDSTFVDVQSYRFALLDSNRQQKGQAAVDVWYNRIPRIDSISIRSGSGSANDTLQLAAKTTFANITINGAGLFRTSQVTFDDPLIRVNDNPGWRADNPPHQLQVGIEIDDPNIELGAKTFRIKNEYAMEAFGSIFLQGSQPPQILSTIRGFVADGQQKEFEIQGNGFSKGIQASIIPPDGYVHNSYVSVNKVKISLTLPSLEQSKSYRLVLTNPDGQADTSAYFSARTTPLSAAKAEPIEQKSFFRGKKLHAMFTVDTRDGWRLNRQRSYEVNIEGDRFPVVRVVNDSTCEAIIKLSDGDLGSALNQHLFTINEVDRAARWRGMIKSRPAPRIYYVSPVRSIHPSDSLSLVIKGKYLEGASVLIDDPEVTFQTIENRGDMIRLLAVSGQHVSFGTYPLELRIEDVPFVFKDYSIQVQPWQDFSEFITFYVTSVGDLPDSLTFKGPTVQHGIKEQDAITVKIDVRKIREEYGFQKVHISGVLTDSSNSIRAQAYDARTITVDHNSDIITWRWRVRERIRSGDRIEITIKNPGNNNKITEFFVVEPHWSEAFHGSTSFVLFKIPFGSNKERTQILNTIGLGISYQPFIKKDFLEVDASFLVGNARADNNEIGVEVSFGLSAIFWQYIQVGIGSNLTGGAFSKQFMFVSTRFKIPIPF